MRNIHSKSYQIANILAGIFTKTYHEYLGIITQGQQTQYHLTYQYWKLFAFVAHRRRRSKKIDLRSLTNRMMGLCHRRKLRNSEYSLGRYLRGHLRQRLHPCFGMWDQSSMECHHQAYLQKLRDVLPKKLYSRIVHFLNLHAKSYSLVNLENLLSRKLFQHGIVQSAPWNKLLKLKRLLVVINGLLRNPLILGISHCNHYLHGGNLRTWKIQ